MQNLLWSPCVSSLLIKKTNKKNNKVALAESKMIRDVKIGIMFFAKTKKSLELKPAKLLSKCFCEI